MERIYTVLFSVFVDNVYNQIKNERFIFYIFLRMYRCQKLNLP